MGRILAPLPYRGPAIGHGRDGRQDGPAGPPAGPVADRRGRRPDGPGGTGRQIGPVEPAGFRTPGDRSRIPARTSARSAPKRSTAAATRARQKTSWPGRNSRGSWISTTPDRSQHPIHESAPSGVRSAPPSAARMRGSSEVVATGVIAGSPGLGVSAAIILMGCRLASRISAWNDMVPLPSGRERRTTDCGMRGRNGATRPRHPRHSVHRKADLRTVRRPREWVNGAGPSRAAIFARIGRWEEDLIEERLVVMDRPRGDRGQYLPDSPASLTVSPCGASGKTLTGAFGWYRRRDHRSVRGRPVEDPSDAGTIIDAPSRRPAGTSTAAGRSSTWAARRCRRTCRTAPAAR